MPPSLLGVLLICYSSRGQQLVFSYPRNPNRTPQPRSRTRSTHPSHRAGRTHAGGLELDGALELDVHDGELDRRALQDPLSKGVQPEQDLFLGFDPQFLSDILSPKVALCDRQFQLTVDDVTFVGHPTLLNADRPGT